MHKTNTQYSFYSKNRKFGIHTSNQEIKDLLIAWILISITFAIARISDSTTWNTSKLISMEFLSYITISGITVGIAFLFHELAHKIVAQKYRCWAEFRADIKMLVLAIFMSFLGLVFIAPGAVMIFGRINTKQNGIISLAGPLTNIIIALILLPTLFMDITNPLIKEIVHSGFLINSWLALFNMIPLWNFDGIKILHWNKIIYASTVVISIALTFLFFMRS